MKPAVFRLAWPCAGALVLSACSGSAFTGPVGCTDDFRYGLNVTVVDSVTNAPPASAVLIARSGAFVDSVGPRAPMQFVQNGPPVLLLSSAGERAGTYDLTIRSPGYRDWTRTGVEVTEDECHVRPITLTARLQK